jgi:hypothetical protein
VDASVTGGHRVEGEKSAWPRRSTYEPTGFTGVWLITKRQLIQKERTRLSRATRKSQISNVIHNFVHNI